MCWRPIRPTSSSAKARFTVAGTDRAIGLFEVAAAALTRNDLPEELCGALDAISDQTITEASFPYGCHVCEVEVDPETGVVQIENYVAVDDVGRAVNPMIVHGQVHGGIAQGVGQALWEQVVYDRGNGADADGIVHGLRDAARRPDCRPTSPNERDPVHDASSRHPAGRRRRHDAGARRGDERDRGCAGGLRRDPCRDAGDPGTGVAGNPERGRKEPDR